jgi:hypothetical protein
MLCGYITKHDKTSHRPNKAQICPYKAFWWLVDKIHDKSIKSRYKPILRRLRGIYTYMHARAPLPTRMRACDPHYARYPPPPNWKKLYGVLCYNVFFDWQVRFDCDTIVVQMGCEIPLLNPICEKDMRGVEWKRIYG